MLRARALLLLAPLLGVAAARAQGADLDSPTYGWATSTSANMHEGESLAVLMGYDRHNRVLAVPVVEDADGYKICLLYDYARTDELDPISAMGLADYDGNRDARNLGLGVRRLLGEKLEFEVVVGHSHTAGSTNSAYAGVIYDIDRRFGLGADLGRISSSGQDDKRLRAFARFYF